MQSSPTRNGLANTRYRGHGWEVEAPHLPDTLRGHLSNAVYNMSHRALRDLVPRLVRDGEKQAAGDTFVAPFDVRVAELLREALGSGWALAGEGSVFLAVT